uniref:Uncharacterized protein n=1 Tax=Rhizophora mucronata TaxID=61149 RepID=A0A2P2NGW6_RHIMU
MEPFYYCGQPSQLCVNGENICWSFKEICMMVQE